MEIVSPTLLCRTLPLQETRAAHLGPKSLSTASLLEFLYDELKQIARDKLLSERPAHTLQPTALVNEAYLRMVKTERVWDKGEFLCAASNTMRCILVDHARARLSLKRGRGFRRRALGDVEVELPMNPTDLLAIHEALDILQSHDPLKAQLVSLRVFAGLSIEVSADALGISRATANRHWTVAKLMLARLIEP